MTDDKDKGEKKSKGEVPISVHLDVQVKNKSVLAHLLFRNTSKEPQYLDPNRSGARGVMNAHFVVTCGGKNVPYTGHMMLKMRPPKPEEYIRLAPGGQFEAKLDITDVYAWLTGKHKYEAFYREYHLNPYKNVLNLLVSNVAVFWYDKPA